MSKKAFHIYNIIALLLLLSFNSLALFGAGMSEGGVPAEFWFAVLASLVIWGIFYFIQFSRSDNKIWRISWLLIMVIFLYFWETGLGVQVGLMIT
ncbi:hypothetical protein [Siminovitchia terrae]|uniref:Uncharacterized protein n=1 Tax=Siminovitchia terrae TaxID=1914933 RepID=A0A429X9D0_SIMTE|nr:hypothetical protein [Siminovitchia terrae]RST59920.1 hypothetical protein D5F11_009400 [Siminovitchia terrae]GIN91888.1 hypothetical protein J22TS1_29390 [Siminovitchia terrae]